MNIKKSMLLLAAFAVAAMFIAGCKCPAKKTAMAKSPCDAAAMAKSAEVFPIAEGRCGGTVRLEKMAPSEVVANQPFDYRIKVTNLTERELNNVVVTDRIPATLVFKSSEPDMIMTPSGYASWSLGTIGPEASQTINATAVASGSEAITCCAEVSYARTICANINIVEPKLGLTKSAPAETLICDRIPLEYIVTNNGSGSACDITIEDQLSEGLTTSDGSNKVVFTLASLGAGQSERFQAMVDAGKTGTYASKAMAISKGMTIESDMPATVVRQPLLAIMETGPEREYMGRPVTYEITVTNHGDGIAKDTVVEAWLPDGVRFDNATDSGRFTHSSPGKVTWNIGELPPKASKKVSVTFVPDNAGSIGTKVAAKAHCADSVTESAEVLVAGIPAILLEVVDLRDPIEVGQNETYAITVTNQGSAQDTNIHIVCELEPGMQYVSSSGPTSGTFADNKINFAPLASLAAKDSATWQVIVKAASTGDMRFTAVMTSSQLTRPVQETEATNFYK